MKRELVIHEGTNLFSILGVDEKRMEEFGDTVIPLINLGLGAGEIIHALNERGDLNDAEWTAAICTLGVVIGQNNAAKP
jgi:hypothetical protein